MRHRYVQALGRCIGPTIWSALYDAFDVVTPFQVAGVALAKPGAIRRKRHHRRRVALDSGQGSLPASQYKAKAAVIGNHNR